MKKISLFALALTTSVAMFAQNYEKKTPMTIAPRFGIKAGVNLAEMRANGYASGTQPTSEMKTSMNGGFFYNAPLGTGGLAIQPELVYSGQGGKMSTPTMGTTPATNSEQDLSYINLPIMLQWKAPCGFFVETGPQAGYLIRGKLETGTTGNTDNKDQFDHFDFSWGAGLGFLS